MGDNTIIYVIMAEDSMAEDMEVGDFTAALRQKS